MTDEMRQLINKLIVQISKGDDNALDRLSCLISARMLAIAMSVVKNKAVAEEVVQESFIRIVKSAHLFVPNTNGYAWICKLTQNLALNALRKEKRYRSVNMDDCFDIASDDNVAAESSARVLLKAAMETLSEVERSVVYQKYFMDFTVRDSASSLGKSKSAVQRAVSSAEEKIKNYLKGGTNP